MVGGARISAFSTVIKSSVGPKIDAPRDPRIGWGSGAASLEFHSTSFRLVLIKGTVDVAPAAVAVCVVLLARRDKEVGTKGDAAGAARPVEMKRAITQKEDVIIALCSCWTLVQQTPLYTPRLSEREMSAGKLLLRCPTWSTESRFSQDSTDLSQSRYFQIGRAPIHNEEAIC